jgi:amidase
MLQAPEVIDPFTQLLDSPSMEHEGPLKGLQFAVKDVFDIKACRIQAGNPDYFSQAKIADETAPAITTLQNAGARLIGKTHTDELGGSLFGINEHYGIPLNSHSPERVPGGSSSGSAAAVAATLVDFALGADTSGSVRAPASFCGIYGLRPTFGIIPTNGVLPISPSLDTVGIFARSPQVIAQVIEAYGLKEQGKAIRFKIIPSLINSLPAALGKIFLEKVSFINTLIPSTTPLSIAEETLLQWSTVIRTIAMYGLWHVHKEWILKSQPTFGQLIHERIKLASSIEEADFQGALKQQEEIRKFMDNHLEPGDIVIFPTVHDIPPLLSSTITQLKEFSLKTSRHTCIAALAGLPEITLPLRDIQGNSSLGMSFLGRKGEDYSLTSFASSVSPLLHNA